MVLMSQLGLDTNCFQNYLNFLLAFLKIFPIFPANLPKFLFQNQYGCKKYKNYRIIVIFAHNLLLLSFVNRENTHSATVLDLGINGGGIYKACMWVWLKSSLP